MTPDGGVLVELPKQPSSMNSIRRVAKLTLDASGTLQGNVEETRVGDRAWSQRWALRNVTSNTERIKPIENILAASIPNFRITKASVLNPTQNDQPFGFATPLKRSAMPRLREPSAGADAGAGQQVRWDSGNAGATTVPY